MDFVCFLVEEVDCNQYLLYVFLGSDYIVATTKLITGRTLLRTLCGVQDRVKLVDGAVYAN